MAKTVPIEIITPERPVLKDEADIIVLPAYEGEMGVLAGHTPVLVQLVEGLLKIRKGPDTETLALSGGFAEIHPGGVKVFAETAEMEDEIDVERARLAAERAKKEISSAQTQQDIEKSQASLRRALIRLRVSEGISKRRPR